MWAAHASGDIRVVRSTRLASRKKIDMARMATRIASGLAAAGIATIMSTAPAQARLVDPDSGPTACVGASCTYQAPPPEPGTAWLRIALGAAGGVALVGAGAATVSSRNRRQAHQAHPA
jgi:hypothetical protein